ncbi:MAG: hypothetical protein CL609_00730 [Anaerolineaceae bacterium]|nr:hypothetical protein [Anaerolineaceae bacterium]
MTTKTPPIVSGGYPVVGHALEMMKDRESLFKRGFREHGDLFSIKLGPRYAVVITGADYNKQFYMQTDKELNMQDGYQFLKASFGEVLFTASKELYTNQRPLLQEIFRRERMAGYIQAMNIEVQNWLDSLGESGEVDISAAMLKLTQFVAGRAFIGPHFEQELGEVFWQQYDAISNALDPVLPPNLPLPKFRRRDRARIKIREVFSQLVQKRRENPSEYEDLITILLNYPMKDGEFLSDEMIMNLFMGLLFAGHETTAGQAAWTITLLLQHPEYLKLVQQEINEKLPFGSEIDGRKIAEFNHIAWAIDETTRLRPSADVQLRTVEEPIRLGEYEIPVGWQLIANAANSHTLPEVFTDPAVYDPLRFSPERKEGKNPFAIVGFGGGMHKCTGMNFAKNEMTVITSLLFQQFDLELLSEDIRVIQGNGANHPSPVWVRYTKKDSKS